MGKKKQPVNMFGLAQATQRSLNDEYYEKLNSTCPKVDPNSRFGWLTIKQHFGPISTAEKLELKSLSK